MNYLTEIRLFYEWLGTHPLPPSAIALWHGLMYIANCCGWEQEITIPLGLIQTRTMMTPSSIYRSRSACQYGRQSERQCDSHNPENEGSACQYGRQSEDIYKHKHVCVSKNLRHYDFSCLFGPQKGQTRGDIAGVLGIGDLGGISHGCAVPFPFLLAGGALASL